MIKKEVKSDHYLGKDILFEIDKNQLTITSFVKNTGHRCFERVNLDEKQSQELKQLLCTYLENEK